MQKRRERERERERERAKPYRIEAVIGQIML